MRQPPVFLLQSLLCLLLLGSAQAAEQRLALVIGNGDYAQGPLRNPANDAADLAAKLGQRGFEVERLLNADQRAMESAIRGFAQRLRGEGKVGLFYFAGHGVESKGRNYLIPIDAEIHNETDLKYEAVDAGRVLDGMAEAGNGLNLVVLDACRNNPYRSAFRSPSRGLSRMTPPKGALVLYATQPGNVARDGDGRNGVFTQHLLAALDHQGLSVEEVFKQTAVAVDSATGGAQTPWIEGVVLGQFHPYPGPRRPPPDPEAFYWQSTQRCARPDCYRAYLQAYPRGRFRAQAQAWLDQAEPPPPAALALSVKPTPPNARVRIMNIEPKYRDGMELPPGRYRIEVTATGYRRHLDWFELQQGQQVYAVELERAPVPEPSPAPISPPVQPQTPSAARQEVGIGHDGRYTDHGDGTVTDTVTQLQWMRCSVGQTWTGSGCSGQQKEMKWDEAKDQTARYAGHSDWRTPSIAELRTLVYCSNGRPDYFSNGKNCDGTPGKDHLKPTLDPKAFPSQNISDYRFWSSSAYAYYSGYAWRVYFDYGYDGSDYRYYSSALRLVRGGQ